MLNLMFLSVSVMLVILLHLVSKISKSCMKNDMRVKVGMESLPLPNVTMVIGHKAIFLKSLCFIIFSCKIEQLSEGCCDNLGFSNGSAGKECVCNAGDTGGTGSIPGSGRPPGEGKWQTSQVFLPKKLHGQRNLAGYRAKCHKERDTTEWLSTLWWLNEICMQNTLPDV